MAKDDPKPQADPKPDPKKVAANGDGFDKAAVLDKAAAAALVRSEVPELDDAGKPTGNLKAIKLAAEEVFDFKVYPDRVVVVTIDGQKLTAPR